MVPTHSLGSRLFCVSQVEPLPSISPVLVHQLAPFLAVGNMGDRYPVLTIAVRVGEIIEITHSGILLNSHAPFVFSL